MKYIVAALAILTMGAYNPETIAVKVTAYCPCPICCGKHANGITATGTNAYKKGVAVDPNIIPLGSRLDIPEYGNWIKADDVGGKIKDNHIDIRFQTHQQAKAYGTKYLRIRVWK